jgi:hypothetical protein
VRGAVGVRSGRFRKRLNFKQSLLAQLHCILGKIRRGRVWQRCDNRRGLFRLEINLSKAGWSWGCVATVDSRGRTIFVADAHRDDGKRFAVC